MYKININKIFHKVINISFLSIIYLSNAYGQVCKTESIVADTPTLQFLAENPEVGIIKDTKSKLTWMRCSVGQEWLNNSCSGTAISMNWQDALLYVQTANAQTFGNYSDWRLPNIKELGSIREGQCFEPSINLSIFPDTPPSYYWSSTYKVNYPAQILSIDFFYGQDQPIYATAGANVRLVRGGY